MAKAATATAGDAPQAPAAKGSKKMIIIGLAVALLAGGGGAAFMMMGQKPAEEAAQAAPAPAGPSAFVTLDQFVVNLAEPDTHRYLQIGITYEVNGDPVSEQIKTLTPVIRSRILLVLSGKTVAQLTSIEGKQQLMDELVDLARVTIQGDARDPTRGVRDVHFSSFVIQ